LEPSLPAPEMFWCAHCGRSYNTVIPGRPAWHSVIFHREYGGCRRSVEAEIRDRYERMPGAAWFRRAHEGKSLGHVVRF
jgi:hypothetical protein